MAEAATHPVLAAEHDRVAVVAAAQKILSEVEFPSGKELRARHAPVVDHHGIAGIARDVGEIPQSAPEFAGFLIRPAMQGFVIAEFVQPASLSSAGKAAHIGLFEPARMGFP